MSKIPSPEVTVHVQHMGEGGPSVVLVHGLLIGSVATWFFGLAPRLAVRRRVLMYDLRGHGLSERPQTGYDLDSMVGDLERVLDESSGAGPHTLICHSFGSAIALRFAARHPEAVERLILIEAPLPFYSEEWIESIKAATQENLQGMLAPIQLALLGRRRRERRMIKQVKELVRETSLVQDLADNPDLTDEEIARVECPVLLVYTTDSTLLVPTRERLTRLLPHASLRIVEGNHWLPFESPGLLADICEEFLDG